MDKQKHCNSCGLDGHQRRTSKRCLRYKPPRPKPHKHCPDCPTSPSEPVTAHHRWRRLWWMWRWWYPFAMLMIAIVIWSATRYTTSVVLPENKDVEPYNGSDTYQTQPSV